jgi:RNA polymerase sigma-70 factor (ECF subfamily)
MDRPELTQLVRRAQSGDTRAESAVVGYALPQVLAWCAALGGPSVDHEDAAHDVIEILLGKLGALTAAEAFDRWLFGVTRRVLARHRRRAWVKRWVPGLDVDPEDPNADPHARTELSEFSRHVQAALDTLPEAQREVLVLCDLQERADSEVAAMLDIPKGTVKSRLRLARKRFRAQLSALEPQPQAAPDPRRWT